MAEIQRVRYTHDAMIDMIIAQPEIHQNELALAFGFTPTWISIVVNSDAFQQRLAERKGELVDPILQATVNDRLNGLAAKSIEKLLERVQMGAIENKDLVQAVAISTKALGYGAKVDTQINNTQYVAFLPARSANSEEWAATYGRDPALVPTPGMLAKSAEAAETVQFTDEGGVGDAIGG